MATGKTLDEKAYARNSRGTAVKRLLGVGVALCVCAPALCEKYDWNNTGSGGALDVASNWTPVGMPGASDEVAIKNNKRYTYTLSDSVQSLSVNKIGFAVASTLDLGAGKSFLAEGDATNSKISLNLNVTLQLLSGTFGVGDVGNRFFLGDVSDGEKVVVSGANSILRSSRTSSVIVGQNKSNCSLLVENGGMFRGSLLFGVNKYTSTGNTAVFTGSGTRFISDSRYSTSTDYDSASATIGLMGSYNELAISNNAEMVVGDGRSIVLSARYGSNFAGSNNTFKVTHGGKAVTDNLYVGRYGSSNKVVVCAGGDLSVSNNTYIGHTPISGQPMLDGNSAFVSGAGSRIFVGGNMVIGNSKCINSLLEVSDGGLFEAREASLTIGATSSTNSVFEVRGGTFVCTNSAAAKYINIVGADARFSLLDGAKAYISNAFVNVGSSNTGFINSLFEMRGGSYLSQAVLTTDQNRYYTCGRGSRFVVDGSTLDAPGLFVCTGKAQTNASSNRLEIVNGAVVNLERIVVGDFGPYCSMDLDDSTLSLGKLHFGYSGKDTENRHAVLRVRGANAKITASSDFILRNDTALEFEIPATGFRNNPIISCKSVETSYMTTPSLAVKRDRRFFDGGRFVLVKATNTDIDMETLRNRLSVTLPEGCTLDLSNAREIAVRVPSRRGLRISLK